MFPINSCTNCWNETSVVESRFNVCSLNQHALPSWSEHHASGGGGGGGDKTVWESVVSDFEKWKCPPDVENVCRVIWALFCYHLLLLLNGTITMNSSNKTSIVPYCSETNSQFLLIQHIRNLLFLHKHSPKSLVSEPIKRQNCFRIHKIQLYCVVNSLVCYCYSTECISNNKTQVKLIRN